jgi:drug/metabolite transporter (DMT)-like permease
VAPRDAVDLVLLGALWGAAFLFTRIAVPEFGPVALILVRALVAALVLSALLAARGGLREARANARALAILGALNTAVPFTLFAFATMTLPAGLSSVLNATVPLFGAVIGVGWLGERMSALRVAGLLTGFAGVIVLAWGRLAAAGDRLAVLAALAATVLYAVAAHYTRRRLGGVTPIAVATGSLIAATVLTLPFGAAFWPVANPSALAWACAVALGIGCTALAYLLYFRLIARLGAVAALAVTYLIPVFGVTWGAIFLDERLPASAFTGALLVLTGVALTTRRTGIPARPAGGIASARTGH